MSASFPLGAIDVHAHFVPDEYRAALLAAGHEKPDGMPGIPSWSIDEALASMDRLKIETAILSISSPGVHFGDDLAAAKLARQVNISGAEIVTRYPGRFGYFASLPLPDVEASLKEIIYVFDVLKADGVVLLTHYNGVYLGDSRLDPVFAELNRRGAVAFIHPTSPVCVQQLGGPWPPPLVEFLLDTTRSVVNLIFSRTLLRYPDIQFIVPHGGAALSVLAQRLNAIGKRLLAGEGEPVLVLEHLKSFHYDLAGFPAPQQLSALLALVEQDKLLWGTDWPFTPEPMIEAAAEAIEDCGLLQGEAWKDAQRGNALRLFPRFCLCHSEG